MPATAATLTIRPGPPNRRQQLADTLRRLVGRGTHCPYCGERVRVRPRHHVAVWH